jgi:hypothetical protein
MNNIPNWGKCNLFDQYIETIIKNMNEQMRIINEFKAIIGIDIVSFLELYKAGIIIIPKLQDLAKCCNEIGYNTIINIFRVFDKDTSQLMKELKELNNDDG